MPAESRAPAPAASDLRPPTLSICVPTFDRPDTVQRAIHSIVEAVGDRHAEVEIIVSDNSPDVSESACRAALREWNGRWTYLANRPNIGSTANLNQCIARSNGRYVLFVCDDDRLLPGSVPKVLDALPEEDDEDAVLLFQVQAMDEAGRVLRRQNFGRDARYGSGGAVRRLLMDTAFAWFPGVVVRRDAYAAVGPFISELGNVTDLEMWIRLFGRYGVRCVPSTISWYSVHPDSATQTMTYDEDAVAQLMNVFDSARSSGVLDEETIRACQAQYLHQFILGATYFHLRSGDIPGARRVMRLFDLPGVKALGRSTAWTPVRLAFALLVRCPPALVRPLMRLVDRVELVRRVRAAQSRSRGPFRA